MAINCDSAGSARGVNHGSAAGLDNLPSADFTVWLIVTRTGTGTAQICGKTAGVNGWQFYVSASGVQGRLGSLIDGVTTDGQALTDTGDTILATGVPTFIALVFTISTGAIALYGSPLTTYTALAALTLSSDISLVGGYAGDAALDFHVGNYTGLNSPFPGVIHRGGIIKRALTAAQLDQVKHAYLTNADVTNTELLFDYQDNTDLTNKASATSGSHDGTLTGSAPSAASVLGDPLATVTNTHLQFTPYNWRSSNAGGAEGTNHIRAGSTFAQTNNVGARFRISLDVASGAAGNLWGHFDVSGLSGLNAEKAGELAISVDDGPWTRYLQVYNANTPSNLRVQLATGLATGVTHTVEVELATYNEVGDFFATPAMGVKLNGIEGDANATSVAPTIRPKRLIAYGDSNFCGSGMLGNTQANIHNDATQAPPKHIAKALDAEVGTVCWGGSGWRMGIAGANPATTSQPGFYNSDPTKRYIDFYSGGQSRLVNGALSPMPDYVVILHGVNDTSIPLTAQMVTDALNYLLTIVGAATQVYVLSAADPGSLNATIEAGIAACAIPWRVTFIDTGFRVDPTGTNAASRYSYDTVSGGQHLSQLGSAVYSAMTAAAIAATELPTFSTTDGHILIGRP